jgi:hypothetical protein
MRIVDIREKTISIASPIANAYIDFSKMTCSVVAVITDVMRDGRPVVGYGFNSNGRYGQGDEATDLKHPHPWHSRAGGGAVHSTTSGHHPTLLITRRPPCDDRSGPLLRSVARSAVASKRRGEACSMCSSRKATQKLERSLHVSTSCPDRGNSPPSFNPL